MKHIHTGIVGCGLVVMGVLLAPLLPFWGLLLIPVLLLWRGLPASAMLFSVLLDSFLVPGGVAPMWVSLTFYTVLLLPFCLYVRYTTTL